MSDQRRDRKFIEVVTPGKAADSALRTEAAGASKPEFDLGPLGDLLGRWTTEEAGWNMIALPFKDGPFNYRVLMNQYREELVFDFIDDGVANRGLLRPSVTEHDQFTATIDYQQKIQQIAVDDFPKSELQGPIPFPIHHEPGLWLWMKNLTQTHTDTDRKIDVARLASIPHGNSVMALGFSETVEGMPEIPPISALPIGRFEDILSPGYDVNTVDPRSSTNVNEPNRPDIYLEPFKHYIDSPFMGTAAGVPNFPGFNPADMTQILRFANGNVEVESTTILDVDTTRRDGGVNNAPFTVREAEPVSLKSTFWIQRLKNGQLRLQYVQVVMLDFFAAREDQLPGRAQWPHISIATLNKEPGDYAMAET